MSSKNGKAMIAVELGNQNIRVAGLDGLGMPKIITNKDKEDFNPNCLFYENGKFVLGRATMSERLLRSQDVITNFKPKIGTDKVVFERDGKKFCMRDLYGEVFRSIKECGERVGGQVIGDMVVTVPEQWGTKKRRDVEKSAKIAGLNVKKYLRTDGFVLRQRHVSIGN